MHATTTAVYKRYKAEITHTQTNASKWHTHRHTGDHTLIKENACALIIIIMWWIYFPHMLSTSTVIAGSHPQAHTFNARDCLSQWKHLRTHIQNINFNLFAFVLSLLCKHVFILDSKVDHGHKIPNNNGDVYAKAATNTEHFHGTQYSIILYAFVYGEHVCIYKCLCVNPLKWQANACQGWTQLGFYVF